MSNNKITDFNKQNLKMLREELNAALKAVADKYEINIHVGNMTFRPDETSVKMVMSTKCQSEAQRQELKKYAKVFGLESIENTKYKLVKIDSRKPKYPFIIERSDTPGKLFKISEDHAQAIFGISK